MLLDFAGPKVPQKNPAMFSSTARDTGDGRCRVVIPSVANRDLWRTWTTLARKAGSYRTQTGNCRVIRFDWPKAKIRLRRSWSTTTGDFHVARDYSAPGPR